MNEDELEQRLAAFRHEAATPVALITAALNELGRAQDGDPDTAELLDTARRQTEVLQRLLEQLRGTGTEDLVLETSRVDLAGLVGQVVTDLESSILAGRDVRLDLSDDAVVVEGDPALLRQALTNLLDNAVKYTGDATTIRVAVARRGDEAELAVTDEGKGIAPEDLHRIFRRFERVDERSEGLGIGLYLVWRIARAHGGHVRALPAPEGSGARFVITLPAVDVG